jgi:hypothetical protein
MGKLRSPGTERQNGPLTILRRVTNVPIATIAPALPVRRSGVSPQGACKDFDQSDTPLPTVSQGVDSAPGAIESRATECRIR